MNSKKTSDTSVIVKPLFGIMTAIWICGFAYGQQPLRISTQQRKPSNWETGIWIITNRIESWKPSETALIVCDMWDKHWCDARFRELAVALNPVEAARAKGVKIGKRHIQKRICKCKK